MYRRPPVSTRTAPLFPPPTLFRSVGTADAASGEAPADAAAAALTHQPAGIEAAGDAAGGIALADAAAAVLQTHHPAGRSEGHTSELQSLMRISYAVFCLKKKKIPFKNLSDETNKRRIQTKTS